MRAKATSEPVREEAMLIFFALGGKGTSVWFLLLFFQYLYSLTLSMQSLVHLQAGRKGGRHAGTH